MTVGTARWLLSSAVRRKELLRQRMERARGCLHHLTRSGRVRMAATQAPPMHGLRICGASNNNKNEEEKNKREETGNMGERENSTMQYKSSRGNRNNNNRNASPVSSQDTRRDNTPTKQGARCD